ncbi:apolipoprotein N-acyltransferase [Ectopseudomonas mendocina]|uniref:Apolipoprotein N-acyltransferase n=1 Tax=Ectopseudomonas mendocina TaxID=300 RepID=A0ABZ2RDD0_ECTME
MHWITRAGWPGHLIALLAGAITPLALAPYDLWPLALVSIGLFYLSLRDLNPRQASLRGWAYGFGLFLAGTSWVYVSIHDYGAASPALAGFLTLLFVAGLGLFFALLGWIWARWLRLNDAPLGNALTFAALWLAQEALRSWIFTGFPWLFVGYSQLDGPLAGLAPLGGVWLISFTLALTAALLASCKAILAKRTAMAASLVLMGAVWISGIAFKGHEWTSAKGQALSVTAVQGNIEQNLKWDPQQLNAQLRLYRDLTFNAKPTDLIIWPETAVPVMKDRATDFLQMLDDFAKGRDAALITGVPIRKNNEHGELRYYNGITVVGQGRGDYLKQKLVPFGEYVPLQEMLRGLIAFFDLPMSDFARGPANQQHLQAKGQDVAALICYEVVYPEFAAEQAARSDLLLTISNDTWFGRSLGPLQHLQMAQMRALEAGRWMIRATNNGVTALIDPQGKITESVPQFEQAILYGEVQPMQGLTPYLQWRGWPVFAVSLLLLAAALLRKRKAGRN